MNNQYNVPRDQIRCNGKCHTCMSRHCGDIDVTGAKPYWRNPEYVWWRVWIARRNHPESLVQLRMQL